MQSLKSTLVVNFLVAGRLVCGVCGVGRAADDAGVLSLGSTWGFRLDPKHEGMAQGWFRGSLPERIKPCGPAVSADAVSAVRGLLYFGYDRGDGCSASFPAAGPFGAAR